jgi:hypothetical protein
MPPLEAPDGGVGSTTRMPETDLANSASTWPSSADVIPSVAVAVCSGGSRIPIATSAPDDYSRMALPGVRTPTT